MGVLRSDWTGGPCVVRDCLARVKGSTGTWKGEGPETILMIEG